MSWLGNARKQITVPVWCAGASFLYAWAFLLGQIDGVADEKSIWKVIAPLVMVLFWRQLRERSVRRITALALATCGAVGGCLVVEDAVEVGRILTSSAQAALLLLWCDVYGRMPIGKSVASFALMQFFSLGLWVVMSALPHQAYPGLCLVMPLASAASMSAAWRAIDDMHVTPFAQKKHLKLGRDLGPTFIMAAFICAFAYGLNQMHSDVHANIVSYGICGLVLLAGLVFFAGRFSLHSIFNIALPLVIAGLVLSVAFEVAIPGLPVMSVNVGYALMTAIFTVILADRSYRFGVSAIWSAGIVRATLLLGVTLGSNVEAILKVAVVPQAVSAQVVYVITIVAIVIAAIAWIQDGDRDKVAKRPLGSVGDVEGLGDAGEAFGDLADTEDAEAAQRDVGAVKREIFSRCEELRDECHLSKRELEILKYLALGWSAPRIESKLVISNSTVKTHIRHIYSKLGIHSRDELKILIGVDAF